MATPAWAWPPAAIKGYRCIFVMADKQSEEKRALLRAYGAEVVICPTDVDPDDERSYYRVSDRIARETPAPGSRTSTPTSTPRRIT